MTIITTRISRLRQKRCLEDDEPMVATGIKNDDTVTEAPFFGQFRTGDPIGGRQQWSSEFNPAAKGYHPRRTVATESYS